MSGHLSGFGQENGAGSCCWRALTLFARTSGFTGQFRRHRHGLILDSLRNGKGVLACHALKFWPGDTAGGRAVSSRQSARAAVRGGLARQDGHDPGPTRGRGRTGPRAGNRTLPGRQGVSGAAGLHREGRDRPPPIVMGPRRRRAGDRGAEDGVFAGTLFHQASRGLAITDLVYVAVRAAGRGSRRPAGHPAGAAAWPGVVTVRLPAMVRGAVRPRPRMRRQIRAAPPALLAEFARRRGDREPRGCARRPRHGLRQDRSACVRTILRRRCPCRGPGVKSATGVGTRPRH